METAGKDMCVYVYMCICVYVYMCMCVCVYVCMCARACARMRAIKDSKGDAFVRHLTKVCRTEKDAALVKRTRANRGEKHFLSGVSRTPVPSTPFLGFEKVFSDTPPQRKSSSKKKDPPFSKPPFLYMEVPPGKSGVSENTF